MTENNKKSTETKSKIKLLLKIKEKENGTSETPFLKQIRTITYYFKIS